MVPTRSSRSSLLALALTLLIALAVAIRLTTPPAPRPVDAPATLFSADRAMRDVVAIAGVPHPTGTRAHAQARAYVFDRLRALGLKSEVLTAPLSGRPAERLAKWAHRDVSRVGLFDIVGTWPGRDRAAPALVLMAHYDTVWGSPGAADDTAGVATLLEDVRAMQAAGRRPARDVILLFTDGEELGLAGAHAYFERPGVRGGIGMVVNHETRGGGGRAAMFETGVGNGAAMRLFAHVVPHPLVTSMSVLVYRLMPNSTDLTVALKQGLPGFNFAFVGRPALYHSPLATPAAIEAGAIQDMGDQSLALASALATAPALPTPGPDAVFGDLLGLTTITYPPAFGWAVVDAAASLLGIGWSARRRIGGVSGRDVRDGLTSATFTLALAAALLTAGNALSTAWTRAEYYDRLAAIHRLEWQAALLSGAAIVIGHGARRTAPRWKGAAMIAIMGAAMALLSGSASPALAAVPATLLALLLPARPLGRWTGWFGAALLLLAVAFIAQAAAPLAAAIFAWPALLAAAAIALQAWRDRPAAALILTLPLGLALGQLLALAHFTFSGIGAPLPVALLAFLVGGLALVRPLLEAIPRHRATLLAIPLLAGAVAIALWVRFDPIAPSVPTYLAR